MGDIPIPDRGLGLEHHLDRYGEPPDNMTEGKALKGARLARRLVNLTGGSVHVYYSPGTFFEDDRDAKGHVFSGWLDVEESVDFLTLDDRKGDLVEQLKRGLQRIARHYLTVAKKLGGKVGAP